MYKIIQVYMKKTQAALAALFVQAWKLSVI